MWLLEPRGGYTMKSAYRSLRTDFLLAQVTNDKLLWQGIWNAFVLLKVQNFVWRFAANFLPSNDKLSQRRVEVCLMCPQGSCIDVEYDVYVILNCLVALECLGVHDMSFPIEV